MLSSNGSVEERRADHTVPSSGLQRATTIIGLITISQISGHACDATGWRQEDCGGLCPNAEGRAATFICCSRHHTWSDYMQLNRLLW